MALARVLEIIAFLIYIQEGRGQFNSLINNNPTFGQNNLNQGFQNTANIKSVTDNLFQKESLGKSLNFNCQKQVNLQPSTPQSSLTTTQQFPLQQSQNLPQLLNQQPSQISDPQQPVLYQPQQSFVQQSMGQQQPYNYLESSAFASVNNAENMNYHQQTGTPSIQPVPMQVSQSIPLSNSYVPYYSSITPVSSGNYLVPVSSSPLSTPERQILTSYPTMPYTMVFSAGNPPTLGNNVIMPYQNQIFSIFDDPLDNFSEIFDDEVASLTSDKIATLLMSLLQTPKKSSKYLQSHTSNNVNQDTKSSSLKSLLPIILNLIKERREGCGCHSGCKCNRRSRNKKDSASQSIERYSIQKDNSLKEEMFHTEQTEEDILRMTREHNKNKKIKNPVPDISIENNENDDMDYDSSSEEEND